MSVSTEPTTTRAEQQTELEKYLSAIYRAGYAAAEAKAAAANFGSKITSVLTTPFNADLGWHDFQGLGSTAETTANPSIGAPWETMTTTTHTVPLNTPQGPQQETWSAGLPWDHQGFPQNDDPHINFQPDLYTPERSLAQDNSGSGWPLCDSNVEGVLQPPLYSQYDVNPNSNLASEGMGHQLHAPFFPEPQQLLLPMYSSRIQPAEQFDAGLIFDFDGPQLPISDPISPKLLFDSANTIVSVAKSKTEVRKRPSSKLSRHRAQSKQSLASQVGQPAP
jgi:hypothetical protein